MITEKIIDILLDYALKILELHDGIFNLDVPVEITNGIIQLFTYANALFPLDDLMPLFAAFSLWFQIRIGLAVFGFIKNYLPLA